jgi:hypothetical protein
MRSPPHLTQVNSPKFILSDIETNEQLCAAKSEHFSLGASYKQQAKVYQIAGS